MILTLLLFATCSASGCVSSGTSTSWRPANVAPPTLSKASLAALAPHHRDQLDPAAAVRAAFVKNPTREHAFALAEAYYARGDLAERENADNCVDFFYHAAAHAYWHLFALHDGQPLDPRMWAIYHSAVARCVQNGQDRGRLDPHKGLTVFGEGGAEVIPIAHKADPWIADDFDQLLVVGDYDASQIARRHRREGFGVPLVAVRLRRNDGSPRDSFLAPRQAFGVTAVLRPNLDTLVGKGSTPPIALTGGTPSQQVLNPGAARIELVDPFRAATSDVGSQTLTLAADYSAAFAACENCRELMRFDWLGFREPARLDKLSGLFFIEPYQQGKIPIVFVHGLWSDFHTWDETLNELRMNPIIRERYQFAVYLYPTGNPFLLNAHKLRKTLAQMPALSGRPDPAMDQMVLVGHSMGGILSRLQVTSSGSTMWDMVSTRPIDSLKTDPATREFLQEAFFFEPNPSVKRVVFIGTPQKGSSIGGSGLRRVASSLVMQPGEIQQAMKKLSDDNPGAFLPSFLGGLPTSIDNLATDNPTIRAINKLPFAHGTRLHSVVGHGKFLPLFAPGDGVVPTSSARLGGVESELLVNDWHTHVHRDLRTIREIERILHDHLDENATANDRPLKAAPR